MSVKVQVLLLLPALEHAPDHTTSRPLVALNVMTVPVANVAEPAPPTRTLMPAGFEVIRSPLRPVAVTVSVAACAGAVTDRAVVRVTPEALAVIVTGVEVATAFVVIAKVAIDVP